MKLIIIKRHSLADLSGDPEADLIRKKNPIYFSNHKLFTLYFRVYALESHKAGFQT